jgi:Ala-tRNA(Pro) deacylase
MNLQTYLDELGVAYQVSYHPEVYTAQTLAEVERIPGRQVIKPVVVEADGEWIMCALPACFRVDLDALREQLGAQKVRLVSEEELAERFPECEMGAEPPLGRMFGLPTVMDSSLLSDDRVTFQAGTHDSCVTMRLSDYRRAAQPELAHFGRQMS